MSINVRILKEEENVYQWYDGSSLRGIASTRLTAYCERVQHQVAPVHLSKHWAVAARKQMDTDKYTAILRDSSPLKKHCTVINNGGELCVVDNLEAFVFLHLNTDRATHPCYIVAPQLWRQYLLRGVSFTGLHYQDRM